MKKRKLVIELEGDDEGPFELPGLCEVDVGRRDASITLSRKQCRALLREYMETEKGTVVREGFRFGTEVIKQVLRRRS